MNGTMGPLNMPSIDVHLESIPKLNLMISTPRFHEEGFAFVVALCFLATTNTKTSLKRS